MSTLRKPKADADPRAALIAYEAECRLISASLVDPSVLPALVRFGMQFRDFGHEQTRPIAEAIWYCMDASKWPDGKPRTIERATVIEALQRLGYWQKTVHPQFLLQLDNEGTDAVVEAAEGHAQTVLALSIARDSLDEAEEFAASLLFRPREAESLIVRHTARMAEIAAHGMIEQDYSIQKINQAPIMPVPGIQTGLAWVDTTIMGICEAELIGIQGMQKKGKTRWTINLIVRLLRQGIPIVYITTDGTAVMFRNRLLCILATAYLIAWNVDERELTLDPRRLNPEKFTKRQAQAIQKAQADIDKFHLWVLDAKAGTQDFETAQRQLVKYVTYMGAKVWVYDHIADLTLRGQNDVSAFNFMVRTFKTQNIDWGTTAILVNQRPETVNRLGGTQTRGGGSYMGGALPQAVDHLYEMDDEVDEVGKMGLWLKMGRWGYTGKLIYLINKHSGLILNQRAYPPDVADLVLDLDYMQKKNGQAQQAMLVEG